VTSVRSAGPRIQSPSARRTGLREPSVRPVLTARHGPTWPGRRRRRGAASGHGRPDGRPHPEYGEHHSGGCSRDAAREAERSGRPRRTGPPTT